MAFIVFRSLSSLLPVKTQRYPQPQRKGQVHSANLCTPPLTTAHTKCFQFFPTHHTYRQYLLPAGASGMPEAQAHSFCNCSTLCSVPWCVRELGTLAEPRVLLLHHPWRWQSCMGHKPLLPTSTKTRWKPRSLGRHCSLSRAELQPALKAKQESAPRVKSNGFNTAWKSPSKVKRDGATKKTL